MEKVQLGNTGIEVSKLGIGTGTAHPSGHCFQTLMDKRELADLLIYAFDHGVNFWDTALQYKTHAHIREALKHIRRSDVIITTKMVSSKAEETAAMLDASLKELGVDYVDVCLVHGVRTQRELQNRRGALDALLESKKKGKVRAVGISSHGLGALKAVTGIQEIDLLWARMNFAGLCMDHYDLKMYDQLSSFLLIKKIARSLLPKKLMHAMRPNVEAKPISGENHQEIIETLRSIHAQSKGVVGMKVLADGHLRDKVRKSLLYVNSLPFIDSFIIGMLNKREIEENCKILAKAGENRT